MYKKLINYGLSLTVFCAVVASEAFTAAAEDQAAVLELANDPGFTERYAGNTQVSGQFLSGLAYSTGSTQLKLDDLRLSYSRRSDEAPKLVCVRVTTDDGRYWASNMYRANTTFSSPPKIPVPTKYGEQLNAYGPQNLLMLATFSRDCSDTAGKIYVPGLAGAKTANSELVAYVNVSQSKVTATLLKGDGRVVQKVNCKKPADGPKVTYSHVCPIPLPDTAASDGYKLLVGVRGLTGTTTEQEYALHLE
ncbi:hypothetical protein J3P71_28045 (plasmid) [Rhizobium leguminosarum]|uniref:hypothetical protein n=1 Tax=Rhizobium leguminosarum TaxID=384 RepID=UPI001441EA19|nr:hypothetical protein [Rhizobium leguminosarum]MBY5835193.1 hypothetical protein [Rhizobium leguminosarum]NKM76051.1 hypothetical protein [Rhizobium leguminosarum bv. viciae]QSZ11017.1 hypothetical protein J3P71_28045 [Rhizobium leguminosarum]